MAIALGLPLIATSPTHARTTGTSSSDEDAARTKIGGGVRLLRTIAGDLPDDTEGWRGFLPEEIRSGASVTLRFAEVLDDREMDELRAMGLDVSRHEGEIVHVGPIYEAFVPWEAFEALRRREDLVRVEARWSPSLTHPIKTGETIGTPRVRQRPDLDHDGEGVVLADIDSGFDIFHPYMFRADGGYYGWVDTNGNTQFDAGEDGVDLDEDGLVEEDEKLRVLDGTLFSRTGTKNRNGTLEPGRDWLYVDRNQNGERDLGTDAGFTESTPAYAEPTFVADDVDDDGDLEPIEKLVRLDTSKFKKVVKGNETLERGEDLIELGVPGRNARSFHGTGATSIMVGGQPGFHDRVGLAPEAELVGYPYADVSRGGAFNQRYQPQLSYVRDAVQSSVDVMLCEWSQVVLPPLDGSTNLEAAMSRARQQQDMAYVTPLGNLNTSKKHRQVDVQPGAKASMVFEIDEGYSRRGRMRPYRIAYGSIQWTSDQKPAITLNAPGGETADLTNSQGRGQIGKATLYTRFGRTTRGTRRLVFVLRRQGESLAQGDWTVEVSKVQKKDTLYGRIADRYSSWGVGIRWKQPTSNESTLVFPSTADAGVGVAGFGGVETIRGRQPGELRKYSGRGPRIDGTRMTDIAAPDDPFAAFGVSKAYTQRGVTHSWFRRFGGTSGASPHVAASLAILADQHPRWGPDKLESRLVGRADDAKLEPSFGGLPNPHWGHGKLNLYRAVTGDMKPPAGQSPKAEIRMAEKGTNLVLDASASSDPDGDSLEYRFDYDYDGTWETNWKTKAVLEAAIGQFTGPFVYSSRVAVRDDLGNRDEAVASLARSGPGIPGGDAGSGSTDASSGDGGRRDTGFDAATGDAPSDDVSGGSSTSPETGVTRDVGSTSDVSPGSPDDISSTADGASDVDGADAERLGLEETRDEGCSCSATRSSRPKLGWLLGLCLGGLLVIRRRRR